MKKFSNLYLEYKTYLEGNSEYGVKVVKNYNYDTSHFPIIDFNNSNSVNSDDATVDGIEFYDDEYFIITIYAKDKENISKNIITEELVELTQKFLGRYKGMKRTECQPIPNMDTNVLRTLIKYQCQIGNVYGNIVRR